jgi:hypothetical protein
MRSVKRVSVVSGECARERRVCAMWGFEEDILFTCRQFEVSVKS